LQWTTVWKHEAELEAVRRGEREANKPFGATPFVRFLGDYLKRVEKEGRLVTADSAIFSEPHSATRSGLGSGGDVH